MNEMIGQLGQLKSIARGYWAERIIAELEYAACLSKAGGRRHDPLLRSAIGSLAAQTAELGGCTRELAEETENRLAPLGQEAKRYRILCPAHAHIDMNWMWRYDETVSVTLETFRTMLGLMAEYPAFTFSQSQASVYRIVEEHDPELLREIRRRVTEGRWEVTASTWVEHDKNLPSGESMARHLLYTRRYLARLFDLDPEGVRIDFEPDTFGHSRNVPEILARGSVRWYYHCRGFEGHTLYRWRAPSGAELLAYRDPFWYNATVEPSMAAAVPEFASRHGMDTMLRAYGVGDHGGGPTRRDIERIIDMDRWPIFPRIGFGTFAEFFTLAEQVAGDLPVVDRELNPIFTGCSSSQARIKAANRAAEARLEEAEAFSGLAAVTAGHHYRADVFARAWERVLFNQFHDILPGSGIADTREFALGQIQRSLASAATEQLAALRRLSAMVDTSGLFPAGPAGEPDPATAPMSDGAGVGWGIESFGLPRVERGSGLTRVYHVCNPSPRPRSGVVELVVWDWEGDRELITVKDGGGEPLAHQLLAAGPVGSFGPGDYWGHRYCRLLVYLTVPALGYATCVVSQAVPSEVAVRLPGDPRVERAGSWVLENDRLRAEMDPSSCALVSLVDKASGVEVLDPARPAGVFRRIDEDDTKGATAWIVGRWMSVRSIHDRVKVPAGGVVRGELRQSLSYEVEFDSSKLRATVSLDRGSPVLRWDVECDWLEVGRKGAGVPQLSFHVPLAGEHPAYRYAVPMGTLDRPAAAQDLPATGWVAAVARRPQHGSVMLVSGQQYGFRCEENSLSVTLIRSFWDPDPFPELGRHRFDIGIGLVESTSSSALIAAAVDYGHPCSVVSATAHPGRLPAAGSLLELAGGSVALSAVKLAEEGGRRLVVRLSETDGRDTEATLRLSAPIAAAWLADVLERRLDGAPAATVEGQTVTIPVAAHTVVTVVVEMAAGS